MNRIRQIMAHNKDNLHDLPSREKQVRNLIFGDDHEDEQVLRNSPSNAKKDKLDVSGKLISESSMEESSIFIHGAGVSKQVKIIDKSKRAFEISNESTKALEISLAKPRNSCVFKMQKIQGMLYALWILLFKHHGLPPKKGSRYPYFFAFAFFVGVDLLLTVIFCVHVFSPLSNFKIIGIPFMLILPGGTLLGPICGVVGSFCGSAATLKLQSGFNSTAVLVNYPLTLVVMLCSTSSDPFYIAVLILLWFNKITLSYTGAKIRQHWLNPGFSKNFDKIQDRFRSLVKTKKEVEAGIKPGMSAQERASSLVNSGLPSSLPSTKSMKDGKSDKYLEKVPSLADSDDEEDEDEDETSFGIIPKSKIIEDTRQSMN